MSYFCVGFRTPSFLITIIRMVGGRKDTPIIVSRGGSGPDPDPGSGPGPRSGPGPFVAAARCAAAISGPGPDLGPGLDPGSGSGPDPPERL